ncbi:MAG: ribosome biogenesis GTP-binding protein YihA/YsxC [Candidatus Sumerlaeia bacterium]
MAKAKTWEVREALFEKSGTNANNFPKDELPQIAFAGRSNVGKSSLLNMLVRKKGLAKTSGTPGRTRLVNFFKINGSHYFVDLPGYGFAKAPAQEQEKWAKMIDAYLTKNDNLLLMVMLLDARRNPSPLDDQLVEFLGHYDIPTILVLTKCDKLKYNALQKARKSIAQHYGLPPDALPLTTSATSTKGRDELLKTIYGALMDDE